MWFFVLLCYVCQVESSGWAKSRTVIPFWKQLKMMLVWRAKASTSASIYCCNKQLKEGGVPAVPPSLPPTLPASCPLMSLSHYSPFSGRCSKALVYSGRHSFSLNAKLSANTAGRFPRAWSVSTTGPRATWRDSWSTRMMWRRATVPGWTRDSATTLWPSPGWWAPSTAPTPSFRTPWTVGTRWSPLDLYQRQRRVSTPTKARRRSVEDAVHWSKVRNSRHQNFKIPPIYMSCLTLN